MLFDQIGWGLMVPLMPFYSERFGATPWDLGAILAIYPLSHLFLVPLAGAWSDRIGRKPILIVSAFGLVVSYVLLSQAGSVAELFTYRLLGSIFSSSSAVVYAAMVDITTKDERPHGMALIGSATSLGFVLGPFLGAVTQPFGPSVPFLVSGLSALIYALLVLFLLPETHPVSKKQPKQHRSSVGQLLRRGLRLVLIKRAIMITIAVATFANAARVIWEATFGLFITEKALIHYDEQDFSLMICFVGASAAVLQLFLLRHLRKFLHEMGIAALATLVFCAGCLSMIQYQGRLGISVALAAVAVGVALVDPCCSTYLSNQVRKRYMGTVFGVMKASSYSFRIALLGISVRLLEVADDLPLMLAAGFSGLAACFTPLLILIERRRFRAAKIGWPLPNAAGNI